MSQVYDAIVIGGGPAGLQAALTLGRVHRRALLLDSGAYRNEAAQAMHNFLGSDGMDPAELRAVGRRELKSYSTVELKEIAAESVEYSGDGFAVKLADGTTAVGRGLILATGVRDTLPDKPGLGALWGTVVAHCPFCHGHEFAGKPIAILGNGGNADHLARIMGPVTDHITVLTDGEEQGEGLADDVTLRTEAIERVDACDEGGVVTFRSGERATYAGIFVTPRQAQAAPFVEQLGLPLMESGCVEVDAMNRTSVPRVYAAGDMAHGGALPLPLASVLVAAASGLTAASGLVAELLEQS